MSEKQRQLYIITSDYGEDDNKACFAISLALTAKLMGIEVDIYLGGPGVKLASTNCKIKTCAEGLKSAQEYIAEFIQNKGRVFVCQTCYSKYFKIKNINVINKRLIEGAVCAGLGALVEMSLNSKVFTF
ncbi:MAG: DsrE family protein [Candidatus Omnitrophica bacterium]|nr:DsrE family protein [Candidatus Omnitrophota bacterium]